MNTPKLPDDRSVKKLALASGALGLSLLFSTAALAGYQPRDPTKPKTPPGSWASRGCEMVRDNQVTSQQDLVLVAPRKYIGLAASTHPTFVWFVSEQAYPVELILFEYSPETGRGDPIQTIKLQSSAGLMQFTLPKDQPGLEVGKTYLWQITLVCQPNNPSKNPWMEAIVEVVAPPTTLQRSLATTTDPLKRAQLYAEADFWYEALAETLKTPTAKSFRQQLITDLKAMESDSQAERLEAVIQYDRTQ